MRLLDHLLKRLDICFIYLKNSWKRFLSVKLLRIHATSQGGGGRTGWAHDPAQRVKHGRHQDGIGTAPANRGRTQWNQTRAGRFRWGCARQRVRPHGARR